jgi:TP901 family phage tail tape measure protein|nr:MAG TPA_asm: tail tape measure protein [Caudoviricetes sp.]
MSLKIDRVQLEIVIQQDQARQKMIELEDKMRSANRELKNVKKQFGENSAEYAKQVEVLKKLQQEYDNLYDEIGLTNLSLRDLGKRQKDLNAILRQLNPNTDLYKQYSEQLKEVNNRIKELRGTANETRFSLAKLADGFNRYGTIAASIIAGLTGVTLTMRSCVNEYAEMEEAQSQVVKYTGLAKQEVEELNEEFKRMDTRTARTRLNELAGDAGKLGITTKDSVLEFVEAADMINVALGEDLGKDAITQIGKLADMFGDGDRSLKENMLAVGSAVNSVAQNSSAAEPYLVEFTARMGGVGKQANLAITDIMGFASALDQNMLRSEMASTALSGLILKLYQEPAKYAKLAGLQVEEFTQLMSKDANEAVLTFLEALNRLGGMDKLAPVLDQMSLSGAEAASVISALAGNVDKVRKEQQGANQAFVEGTSIYNEFSVQNSTVQAELDKAKKSFSDIRVELGEQLLPVMKYMVTTGSLTVKGLSAVVSILIENKRVIVTATAAVSAYIIVVKSATLATKAYEVATKAATWATNLFSKATKASPWGLVISGATAAATYFAFFRDETDKATESQKNLNEALNKNAEDMAALQSVQDRAKNLDSLNQRQLTQLKADAQAEVQAIEDKLTAETIAYRKYYAEQKKIIEDRTDIDQAQKLALLRVLDNNTAEKAAELDNLLKQKNQLIEIINKIPEKENIFTTPTLGDTKKKVAKAKKEYETQLKDLRTQHALGLIEEEKYQEQLYALEVKFLAKKRELYAEANRKNDLALVDQQLLSAMTVEANRQYANKLANQTPTKQEDASLNIIEEEAPEEDNYFIDKYKQSLDGQLALLEAFHDAGIISEMEYQDRLTEITKQKEEERAQIRKAALDTFNQLAGSVSQLMSAMQDSEISKVESRYDAQIKAAQKAGKDTTELEEQKEEAVLAVKRKYADKQFALQVLQVTSSTAVAAMEAYKAMAGIPVIGPALGAAAAAAAVIAGAAQIAVAKQQADEAKGLYSGGYSDDYVQGYTAKGDSRDVAGVIPVHKNEFVANHEGVANPHVKQFLDVFDIAQKNGTIGMINTTQILQQVRMRNGKYNGGYTTDSATQVESISGASSYDIKVLIQLILAELRISNKHLSNIATKEMTVSVRTIRDGIKRLEMLEKNASR